MESNFVFILALAIVMAVFVYRLRFFQENTVGYFSLVQLLYLIVIPLVILPYMYGYIQTIMARPLVPESIITDKTIVFIVLLAFMYAYGGVAIHASAKLLSHPDLLRYSNDKAGEINRFFHLSFSHNLVYSGMIVIFVGISLLEINHLPVGVSFSWFFALAKSLLLTCALGFTMISYTRSDDHYSGRWSDLKVVFLVGWIGFVLLLHGMFRFQLRMTSYQLLLPVLLALGFLGMLSLGLVLRRVGRGKYQLQWKWQRFWSKLRISSRVGSG